MSGKGRFGIHFVLCLIAVATVATLAFLWLGFTPLAATLAAVALGCPVAALSAWRLARRSLRVLDDVRHARYRGRPT